MLVLLVQVLVLSCVLIALLLWAIYFPYPSPLVRSVLPPRARWPEVQIRKWLADGGFNRKYLQFFYRDPERTPPSDTGILSPADGVVTSAEVHNGIRYLVIALSFWDVHVQRSPTSGTVISIEAMGDEFMDGEGREWAFLREKLCPVQKRITFATNLGPMSVRLVTSLAARRIEVWVRVGECVEHGQRVGRILLGSTVVLELPAALPILVHPGERVWAGETLVGTPVMHS